MQLSIWLTLLGLLSISTAIPINNIQNDDVQVFTVNTDDYAAGRNLDGYRPPLGGEQVQYRTYVVEDGGAPPNPFDIIRHAKQIGDGDFFSDVNLDAIEAIVPVDPQQNGGAPNFYVQQLEANEEDAFDIEQDLLEDAEALLKPEYFSGARKRKIRFTPVFHG